MKYLSHQILLHKIYAKYYIINMTFKLQSYFFFIYPLLSMKNGNIFLPWIPFSFKWCKSMFLEKQPQKMSTLKKSKEIIIIIIISFFSTSNWLIGVLSLPSLSPIDWHIIHVSPRARIIRKNNDWCQKFYLVVWKKKLPKRCEIHRVWHALSLSLSELGY